MNDERAPEATPRPVTSQVQEWHRRLEGIQQCKTLDAIVALYGPPTYRVQQQGFEIWHYPLGVDTGMEYSIHVSVWPDRSPQAFLDFEPSNVSHSLASRYGWVFRKH
jgi:hypothetical protein